jgi:hypothetical protein
MPRPVGERRCERSRGVYNVNAGRGGYENRSVSEMEKVGCDKKPHAFSGATGMKAPPFCTEPSGGRSGRSRVGRLIPILDGQERGRPPSHLKEESAPKASSCGFPVALAASDPARDDTPVIELVFLRNWACPRSFTWINAPSVALRLKAAPGRKLAADRRCQRRWRATQSRFGPARCTS